MAKTMENEEESTTHKAVDLETWGFGIWKCFDDFTQLRAGFSPVTLDDFRVDTDPMAMPHHFQPYTISDLERAVFKTNVFQPLTMARVADSHC